MNLRKRDMDLYRFYILCLLLWQNVRGLEMTYKIGEKERRIFGPRRATASTVTNDNFHLLCLASTSMYSGLNATFPGNSDPEIILDETAEAYRAEVRDTRLTTDHGGVYTCTAFPHDPNKTPATKSLDLRVQDEVPVHFLPDSNMCPNACQITRKEETAFEMICSVRGIPEPEVIWLKDGKELPPKFLDNETLIRHPGTRLNIKKIRKEKHEGNYTCVAKNRVNEVHGSVLLNVIKHPHTTHWNPGTIASLAVLAVMLCALAAAVATLLRRVRREREFRRALRRDILALFETGNVEQLNRKCTVDDQAELLPYDSEWEVQRSDIVMGKQIGSGAYGRVVKAMVSRLQDTQTDTTVAVKMCKTASDVTQVRSLALELKILIHLGRHLNIVNLMGASTINIAKGELWILVEFCHFGNLLLFLHRHRHQFIDQIDPISDEIDPFKMHKQSNISPIADKKGSCSNSANDLSTSMQSLNLKGLSDSKQGLNLKGLSGSKQGLNLKGLGGSKQNLNLVDAVNGTAKFSAGANGDSSDCGFSSQSPLFHAHIPAHPLDSSAASTCQTIQDSGYDVMAYNSLQRQGVVMNRYVSPKSFLATQGLDVAGLDSKGTNQCYDDVGLVPGVNSPFTTSDLICWAWQVAQGMDYLASRKVLHGDLAARNLLLADNNVVKISDFGLSRDLCKRDIYTKKFDDLMPIKWMSVEAVRERVFSLQSDVWAYGVTLWELFSLGGVPYPDIGTGKDFLALLESGYRMDKPRFANQEMYQIMLKCWAEEPMERPSFMDLSQQLQTFMLPGLAGEFEGMNDSYVKMNEEQFRDKTDYLKMLSSPDFDLLTKGDDDDDDEEGVHKGGEAGTGYVNLPAKRIVQEEREEDKSHYLRMDSHGHS